MLIKNIFLIRISYTFMTNKNYLFIYQTEFLIKILLKPKKND
jgi:hypothetical protein